MKESQFELLETKGIECKVGKVGFACGDIIIEMNSTICAVFSCASTGTCEGLVYLFKRGRLKYNYNH